MIGAIIQARLGSERLPRKVLLPMPKESKLTVLARIMISATRAISINIVCLTTPDKELIDHYKTCGNFVSYLWTQNYRDPLGEFYLAATLEGLDTIVRITADCPLLTSEEIDRVVTAYILAGADYAYNHHDEEGPKGDGMDVEVFSYSMLKAAHFQTKDVLDREHVTPWIRKNAARKIVLPAPDCETLSLNTMEDYDKICEIWTKRLEKEKTQMT